jgi:cytochrome P450
MLESSTTIEDAQAETAAAIALPPGSRVPGFVQTLRYTFEQPRFFAQLRTRYGPTFSLKMPGFPPIVVTGDRTAVRTLFTGDPLKKRHGNDLLRPFLGDRSLIELEPAEHLERRKLELRPFHGESVRAYRERILELATDEVERWPAGEVVAVHRSARRLTLAVILELVLGVRDASLRDEITSAFDSFNTPMNNLAQFMPPWATRRSWWNVPVRVAYRRIDRVRALLEGHIATTREDPGLQRRDDVLALLVRARDQDGAALSDLDLRDELMTLVAAGHETTATAIAWAADLLAHNPTAADRVRETLAEGDREYLKATAKEVLRARTIAYVSAARQLLEPLRIGHLVIASGTLVLVDAQGMHGDPQLYPDPDAFRPERFLGEQPDSYSYVPFGGGAHRCLGAALATMELELAIEAIVTRVRIAAVGPPAGLVRRGVTLAPDNEGRVRIVERLYSAQAPH